MPGRRRNETTNGQDLAQTGPDAMVSYGLRQRGSRDSEAVDHQSGKPNAPVNDAVERSAADAREPLIYSLFHPNPASKSLIYIDAEVAIQNKSALT